MTEVRYSLEPHDIEWEMNWAQIAPDGSRMFPDKPEKEMCFEDGPALAHLIINNVVFLNSHWWEKDWPARAQETIAAAVNCGDTFAYACADAEILSYDQIEPLWRLFKKDPAWGPVVWCMIQRKQLPIEPVKNGLIKAGWDVDALIKEHGLKSMD